jgi:hypothetical protein
VGDDDLDLLRAGHYRGMTIGVAPGFIACDSAAGRVRLTGGLVTPPPAGTRIVKPKRHVVAAGDPGATGLPVR